jgi:hypothetical protein
VFSISALESSKHKYAVCRNGGQQKKQKPKTCSTKEIKKMNEKKVNKKQ